MARITPVAARQPERRVRDGRRMRSAIASGLLVTRFRKGDRELLAAEPPGNVERAELRAEHVGDAAKHRVAGEVAVRVVHLAQEVEVGEHDRQWTLEPLRALELAVERAREVAGVEELRLGVEPGRHLEARELQRAVDDDERREDERHERGLRAPTRLRGRRRAARARSRSRGCRR